MRNLGLNKILWTATTLISLGCAVGGIINPGIYSKVMPESLMPGAMAQDLLTVAVATSLLVLIASTKKEELKKQIIILGIIGSLGYLYAIFSIERMYNYFYLAYLLILGLSLYSIPITIGSMEFSEKWTTPGWMKWASIIFSGGIGILFSVIWISALIPAMMSGEKIELYYSIYILDLAWIMPGFLITSALSIKNKAAGLLLTPAMYILGIFVIFPLGLGEAAKLFYGMAADNKAMMMSFGLALTFMVMAGIHLSLLKRDGRK